MKHNYFEWFGLPVAIELDLDQLKQRFLLLQQQFHPDRERDQVDATARSSDINHAYQTLKHFDTRAAYLLSLHQQDQGLEQSISDFEFLQVALELREQLEDATTVAHLQQLRAEVKEWTQGLEREFKIDFAEQDWAEARDTVRKLRFFKHVMLDIDQAEDRLNQDADLSGFDDFDF